MTQGEVLVRVGMAVMLMGVGTLILVGAVDLAISLFKQRNLKPWKWD